MTDDRAPTPTGQTGAMDEIADALAEAISWIEEMYRTPGWISRAIEAHELREGTNRRIVALDAALKNARALRAVLPALSPPAIGDRWQPIESVPAQYKDEGRELYVCRFGKETAPTYNVVFWDNNIGRWAFAEDMDRSYHPDFPTHWQLPEPPAALHTDEKKGG